MATLQSTGIGSGLDVSGLVSQLVAAERAPKQNQITKEQAKVATQISAMGSLKGALSAFQSVLAPLKTIDAFSKRSATSGDEEVFTATATASAPPGLYDVEVTQLAKAQQLSSDAFEDGAATVVGTGLLNITVGSKGFVINIDDANDTLADIRDAINKAPGNTGVRAAIVQATDGAHLVLTSTKTGAANVIKITASDGNGGLSRLTYSAPADTANYTQLKPAADAIVQIAGYEHKNDSNVVDDAIDGVTLTLLKEQPGTAVSLDIDHDLAAAEARINNFVSQYNALAKTLGDLQGYQPSTQQAGPLLGDALLRGIDSELKRGLATSVAGVTGPYQTLASIGITTNKDGTLAVDATQLRAALEADFDGVGALFGSESGIAARLDESMAPRLAASGDIAVRNRALDQRTKSLVQDRAILDARMAVIQQRYMKQFSALDGLLSQLQSTSTYLAQQLANLPKIGE